MPGIALTRPVPRSDAALSVTVAFAPFERVLPAVVGLFRAHFGYSLLEDAFENNFATRERLEATETQPNVTHAHVTVISQPKAVPDVTLIEDWPGVISAEAGSMLPDVSFLSLLSHFENARTEQHRMRWQVGPDVIRRVELSRGMEQTGWFWRQEGPVQPFESQERYALRTISTRCDRALLFEYAERLGVDLQATLGDRAVRALISRSTD